MEELGEAEELGETEEELLAELLEAASVAGTLPASAFCCSLVLLC